jgi:hypothetical protein
MMARRGIRQVVARKLALRFTHNVYKPGFGETHLKTTAALAEFENDTVKGMAYWPTGGKSVVVSFALPGGDRDMYEVSVEEIVGAALRWRNKRNAVAMSPAPTADSLPLLPEADAEDAAHGNLGEPGTVQGPLAPPDMPDAAPDL